MENEKNTNKNSSSTMVWIVIGILVIAAIAVTVIATTNQTRPSQPNQPIIRENEEVLDQEFVEQHIEGPDELITDNQLQNIHEDMEKDCLDHGGVFLDDLGCQLFDIIFYNYDWQLADEMILSCQENNGTWLANKTCIINGVTYQNFQWTNIERLENLTRDCIQSGGTWVDGYWECEGVNKTICEELEGWDFNDCLSACRYIDEAGADCDTECVSVCYF